MFTMASFFNSTTKILQGFAYLCKLRFLSFKPHWARITNLNMKENTKLIESGPNSKTSLCKWPTVRVGHFVKIPFQFSLQNSLFFDTKL